MKSLKNIAAACAAVAILATPTAALAGPNGDAEALRKLDIMLMVTSLRCRTTADNFQADYQRFSARNLTALNAAAHTLEANLVKKAGASGAKRTLDKISVGMANEYGNGHPWLGCGELKQITRSLASGKNAAQLTAAADELLSSRPRGQWAMANSR
jgi:hypothetical protein